jgi:hypothetical protein
MAVEGAAAFKYESGGTQTHNLEQPLRDIQPVRRKKRYVGSSIDFSAFHVVTIGSGVHEIVATIRYESDPSGLLDVLEHGADGGEIDYYPDTVGAPAEKYDSWLIAPGGDEIALMRDSQLGNSDYYEVQIHLRCSDGGNYDALLT